MTDMVHSLKKRQSCAKLESRKKQRREKTGSEGLKRFLVRKPNASILWL